MRLGDQAAQTIKVMENLYKETFSKIDGSKTTIPIKIGLRQEAVESCSLFNYWLDTVMRFVLHDIELALPNAGIEREFNICSENTTRAQRMKAAVSGMVNFKVVKFADDIFVGANSREELLVMMRIIAEKFENIGMKLAESKTVTMTWNTTEEIMTEESLISINGTELKNLREFRYLGHTLLNHTKPKFLTAQIGLAYAAWNDHKKMLTDHRIKLWIQVRIVESTVRSRLTFALQTDRLKHERKKIDGVWLRMCRKMVRGSFRRRGGEKSEESIEFLYKNEDITRICATQPASIFCEIQHLKFVRHVARMENDAPQKQWLFAKPARGHTGQWKLLGRDWNMAPEQCVFL